MKTVDKEKLSAILESMENSRDHKETRFSWHLKLDSMQLAMQSMNIQQIGEISIPLSVEVTAQSCYSVM